MDLGRGSRHPVHAVRTFAEVGEMLGITAEAVALIERKALIKCRKKFAELFARTDDNLEYNPGLCRADDEHAMSNPD